MRMIKMNVRIKLLFLSLIPTLSAPSVAMASGDGLIQFSGKLFNETCKISINSSGNASSTVHLPTLGRGGVNGQPDQSAGRTFFTFRLTQCAGSASKARVFFQGGPHVTSDGTLENTKTSHGAASGVVLQLYDETMTPIKVGFPTQLSKHAAQLGELMTYTAGYLSTSDAVGTGIFTTSATYSISYE